MAKIIVIAEQLDDVIVVTPRSPHRARGHDAAELYIVPSMAVHPQLTMLVDEVEPCFATDAERFDRWRPAQVF